MRGFQDVLYETAAREVENRKGKPQEQTSLPLFHESCHAMVLTPLRDNRIIDINEAASRLLDCSCREGLVGLPLPEIYTRDGRLTDWQTGTLRDAEARLATGRGENRDVLYSTNSVTLNGQICMVHTFVDVSERDREMRSLRQSQEKYRTLVEEFSQGLSIIQDGRYVFCNEALCRMLGYSREELLSLSSEELEASVHCDDRARVWNRYQNRLAGKPSHPVYEYRAIRKDGSEFWVQALANIVEYDGKPSVQLTYLDISERKEAEARAREAGERLQLALEAAGMTSWDLDIQTGAVKDEERWLRSLGYKVDEIEPNVQAWNALMHPDDLPYLKKAASDHLEGKSESYEVQHRLRHKSGSWVWVLDRGKIISRDSTGKPLRTVGVHFNITEYKAAVEQIQQLANEQKAILNTINMGICYLKNRTIQWANPAFLQMFGFESEQLAGLDTSSLHANRDDFGRIAVEGYRRLESGELYSTEALMQKGDGSLIWCSIAGQVINAKNLDDGTIWVFQDITARKRAEDALKENENRFRRLLQNSSDIIAILNEKGVPTYFSGPVERILGYTPEEAIGTDPATYVHPDDYPKAVENFREVIKQPGEIRRIEVRYRHKNGHWLPVETVSTNLLCDPVVNGVVLNIRDISERNKLQEQLQQAMKMEAIGVLAGGIAHDFNNLLSVINGYSELLLDELSQRSPLHKDVEQIAKAGQRAAALTSQLLAFSRKQILQPVVLGLNTLISDLSTMLRRLIGEDVELSIVTQSDLGTINADPGQIQQIIMNLAVNARDAMPEGGKLTIETANVTFNDDYVRQHPMVMTGSYVMLAVSDNGIGMDPVTQSRIFEPFFTTKDKSKGTGLGLSTVYGIVKQSNGFIWVYSEPGQGTTFKVYFPLAGGRLLRSAEEAGTEHQYRGRETILIAEDEESVRALASKILRDRGYTVLEAQDGAEAIALAGRFEGNIHLVLTDVVMPGMSGRALVSNLKTARPGIKSLYISGYADNAIVHHGLLDSNISFLQKPFAVESLARKIREVLS